MGTQIWLRCLLCTDAEADLSGGIQDSGQDIALAGRDLRSRREQQDMRLRLPKTCKRPLPALAHLEGCK